MHAISISDISEIYGITQLASSICHMLDLGDNGTSTWQWDYHTDMLPLTFHFLDMWTNFHLAVYGFNDFYKTEYISIHCKPERDGRGAQFSPVFIEVNPLATGIHCEYSIIFHSYGFHYNKFKGYRPAEVRIVFRPRQSLRHPDLDGKLYAFVCWYSKIPQRPNQLTKMYKVSHKLDMHGQWRSGVVKLSQLKGLCPLAPSIKGESPSGIMMDNCFNTISDYHINHFSSHSLFRHLHSMQ